jgi:hypothetical protein
MSFADYNEIIQREFVPGLIDTVVYKSMAPLISLFGTKPNQQGDRITSQYRLAHTSNAAFYGKGDVNPAPGNQTLKKPYWTKVFSHGACEVHGIDMSNAKPSGIAVDMVQDTLRKEVEALTDINVAGIYAQILADVDSSGTAYSDASLSRSTYPLLVSYEETTNAAISLAYFRAMIKGVMAGKGRRLGEYICLMEQAVYNVFRPLAAAVNSWVGPSGTGTTPQATGYPEVGSFEGVSIFDPYALPNMTTGTVFMLRKEDVNLVIHRALEVEVVPSGRDSIEMIPRIGVNCYVDNPYLQGKMLDKD